MVKVVGQDNTVSVEGYAGKALIDPAIVFEGKNGKDGKDGKDGVPGPEGLPGRDGINGVDGKDGKDGRDGIDGKDGISYWIEYDKKTNTLIFKNDGGKKSPDPVKLAPLAKGWGYGAGRGGGQVQADWNQTDKTNPTYIKNKPAIHNIRFLVVEELPTVGDPWTIYMIQEGENQRGGSGGNIYSEWIFVENDITHTLSWEKIGTDVDLNGYVQTSRTINGKSLESDITLTASDVGALPDNTVIPTVNDATLTIQKNGTAVATFTANSSTNQTANITVPTDTGDLTNNAGFITGIDSSDVTTALGYTPYDASNPSGYTSNVGTVTSVNNTSPDGSGNVTISIPTVDQSYDGTSTNAQSGTAVKSAIDAAISSVYKPAGSVAFASLPALSSSIEGYVYNVTDSFTTTSDFVEGAGKTYPAGTNVVCIDTGSSVYKWDVLSGFVDLSGYVPTSRTVNGKALSSDVSLTASDVGALPDSTVVPTINSTNNYVPYRSGASTFANSTLMYNSNAMAFTGRLHVGSSSPASYYNKGRFTIYDNTPSQQVSSIALLNYGGGGGCGVAIDMYNTSANGGIPSGRFGLVDNGNYSGYLQLQVKKSGAQSNPLLPAMNIVPVPATNSLTTCVSFGQDEFNRVLFDLHKPEAITTITDSDKRWAGSGTTYYVTGSNKFNPRLLVAVGDIVSFDSFATEATVTGVVSNSTTCQITTNVSLGTISNKNISVKKAYFKITDENNNIKVYVNPYGKFGIGTGTPAYDLDVAGSINASTDVKVNGSSVLTSITGTMVTNALGYTPYDSSNPSGYTSNVGTVTSVNNTSPDSDGNVSLTIPTVNDATLTIQKNGTDVATFTANSSTNQTANITVPTQASDIGAIDTNVSNISSTGKTLISSLGLPSSSYATITVGASNAEYTATKNGWFAIDGSATVANGYIYVYEKNGAYRIINYAPQSAYEIHLIVPAVSGAKFYIGYGGATISSMRFVYAEGDK